MPALAMPRAPISEEKKARLRHAFAAGLSVPEAARYAKVSRHTARNYAPAQALGQPVDFKGSVYGLPKYDGPDWIGKAC